ncbi:TSC complex subunit 1a isoform X2 [Scomber scombrus]|uniref:TSC complex subunit 1a isoform X2 n=1 Tax=Scomber scombrus TaxID=13677 RepID=UPI002DD938F2|nr:TSC complex subunit 1a isoform X2 [Scomber scombrus]
MMSREQVSISELLLSLDSSELQEAELVRTAVNLQLSSDRGGAVLCSLVDYYLDCSSPQALLLLSSVREAHHKPLLEKLNESLNRPVSRQAALTLLGHLIRKQPPWVHHISRSNLLTSLLRCLKTDSDVVVLITGVLVLITLLPMIPQAGKQHIYDFFDVFGRLASWSLKNPGHVPVVHLVHLQASVYSLFHRLYGMFPCNFISYLRLHYSMKENLDTFQEVVKPMLEHVRVHPELVSGTQDYELDPSRWKCYEVHDIVIECSRVSLDPLESSCEEDAYSSLRDLPPSSPRPPPLSPLPHLDLTCSPYSIDTGSSVCRPSSGCLSLSHNSSYMQADEDTWSPSSECGLSTPPPEPAAVSSVPPLSRTTSISGVKCPSSASVPLTLTEDIDGHQNQNQNQVDPASPPQVKQQPITEQEKRGHGDVITYNSSEGSQQPSSSSSSSQPVLLTSTPTLPPAPPRCSLSLSFTPPHRPEGGSTPSDPAPLELSPPPPYDALFDLALPRAASLFLGRKTQEVLERASQETRGGGGEGEDREEDFTSVSPLKVLDQLIIHGHDAHQHLSRRCSTAKLDRSHFGGQSEDLQALSSELLLVHSQLQYERFKRQQHAVRNRRLLRRVVNATALEEQTVAMKAQLAVQDEEIRSLKTSLQEEQRRYTELQKDTHTRTTQLNTHIQQLLLQQQDGLRDTQRLQGELQECQSGLKDVEAELQKANNTAYNAEHQLTQLSLKLCSSEQLQQQIYMLNQQLVLLRETNRTLREQLEAGDKDCSTEATMLQCSVGREYQRLKDSDVQQRQKLEAANHRIAELETQLTKKDQLILEQKKLLEDTKNHSRAELSACESRCVGLRRITQSLQTEMLHLYSQMHLEPCSRSNGSEASPFAQDIQKPRRPSSSSVGIINGGVAALSTSPLHLLSCSSSPLSLSPIDSPLAVGSFLEQRARQLFRPANQGQDEEQEEEEELQEEEEEDEEEEAQPESPPLGQEAEEASLLTGSLLMEPPAAPRPPAVSLPEDLTLAVRQRRHELSIMDYDETLPEY